MEEIKVHDFNNDITILNTEHWVTYKNYLKLQDDYFKIQKEKEVLNNQIESMETLIKGMKSIIRMYEEKLYNQNNW